EEVGGLDNGAQNARAGELCRLTRSIEGSRSPKPIEILVNKTRRDRNPGVEIAVGGDVVKSQGKLSPSRTQTGADKTVERYRAAYLVAVRQRRHEDMRPRDITFKACNVIDPGVAHSVGFDVRRGQLDGIVRLGHAELPIVKWLQRIILHSISVFVTPA